MKLDEKLTRVKREILFIANHTDEPPEERRSTLERVQAYIDAIIPQLGDEHIAPDWKDED